MTKNKFIWPIFCLCITAHAADWPGSSPDCWKEPRIVHATVTTDHWQKNTHIQNHMAEKPSPGTYSPNKGYFFTVTTHNRPDARIEIYVEKDHLIQIHFTEIFGMSDTKWINEKLLFMKVWWGRIAGTDLIYDVEQEKIIYAQDFIDGYQAYQQFQQDCPQHGCACIPKRTP